MWKITPHQPLLKITPHQPLLCVVGLWSYSLEYGGGGIKAQVGADDIVIGNIILPAHEFGRVYDMWGDFGGE